MLVLIRIHGKFKKISFSKSCEYIFGFRFKTDETVYGYTVFLEHIFFFLIGELKWGKIKKKWKKSPKLSKKDQFL